MEDPTNSPSPTPALIGQALVHRRLAASLKDWPPVTMTLVGVNVAIHLAVGVYDLVHGRTGLFGVVFGDRSVETLDAWGARVPRLISLGEPWRLLSCTFLHAGALHLFMNMVALWGLGRLAEAVYGPGRFLWLYLLCGLSGSLLSNAAGGTSVGASGAIFGIMGACIVYGRRFQHVLPPPAQPYFGRKLLPWVGVNLLIGFSIPHIDQLGHVGGLVGGLVLAAVIGTSIIPGKEGTPATARLMAFGSAALLGWAVTGVTVSLLGL
jgi:rhomboid protease GluP